MAPTGSFRNKYMRGNSSSNSTDSSHDDSDVQMQGWMRKQKETLRSWGRRYFTLNGKTLTYYDSEDTSRPARGVLEFVDVTALTTETNGLALHLIGGKEVRLIADTHVAYTAWMAVLSAAVKKQSRSNNSKTYKEGWAHCLTDDEVWTRYYVVIKNDSFSCYESETEDAELALSGLVRSVDEWDGKRYGLVAALNRARKIKLAFDSAEEKMSWFLTLEFAVSYGTARMKKESSMKAAQNPASRPNSSKSLTASSEAESDDGVWI
uniref:PH domain-containing protein n=1 Tax=Globisporangium ultimum (strain ATCC 200006 / CBS 805.95 / DAOM BR144) TaxID=431595 RepID=K3W8H7_GLOUD